MVWEDDLISFVQYWMSGPSMLLWRPRLRRYSQKKGVPTKREGQAATTTSISYVWFEGREMGSEAAL
jgi:hypothetical protein